MERCYHYISLHTLQYYLEKKIYEIGMTWTLIKYELYYRWTIPLKGYSFSDAESVDPAAPDSVSTVSPSQQTLEAQPSTIQMISAPYQTNDNISTAKTEDKTKKTFTRVIYLDEYYYSKNCFIAYLFFSSCWKLESDFDFLFCRTLIWAKTVRWEYKCCYNSVTPIQVTISRMKYYWKSYNKVIKVQLIQFPRSRQETL